MKIRVLSDLHIEYHPFTIPKHPDDAHSVLVLAGDIGQINRKAELMGFLNIAAKQFGSVVYVMGNHEYYKGMWPDALSSLRSWELPDNIHILERDTVVLHGITFVGTTLWSNFENGNRLLMQNASQLYDFKYIRTNIENHYDWRLLLPEDQLNEYLKNRAWLDSCLTRLHQQGEPVVLVTHHGFSLRSIHETYKNNPLNGAFVSDCDWLIEKTQPLLAIHGHVHNGFDYFIGSTRVIVNPRGYTKQEDSQENPVFDPYLSIEL